MCVIGSTKLATAGETRRADSRSATFPAPRSAPSGPRLTAAPPERPSHRGVAARRRVAAVRRRRRRRSAADVAVSLPEGDEGERAVDDGARRARARRPGEGAGCAGAAAPDACGSTRPPTRTSAPPASPGSRSAPSSATELHFVAARVAARSRRARAHGSASDRARADRRALAGRPAWVREGAAIHFAERVRTGHAAARGLSAGRRSCCGRCRPARLAMRRFARARASSGS